MTNLLAISGGGFMGIGPAMFLSSFENSVGYRTTGKGRIFGAFAGTSVGAINAAMLAADYSAKELLALHRVHLPSIFGKKRMAYTLAKCGARYDDHYVNILLKERLPMTFGEIHVPLMIVAWDRCKRDAKVFSSLDPKDARVPVWEAVRASMAAPTYFAPWKQYFDGGMTANNPTLHGIAGLASHGVSFGKVLDIETSGTTTTTLPLPDSNAFLASTLADDILPAITAGNSSHVPYIAKSWIGDRYMRVSPLCKDYALDDTEKAGEIEALWQLTYARKALDMRGFFNV